MDFHLIAGSSIQFTNYLKKPRNWDLRFWAWLNLHIIAEHIAAKKIIYVCLVVTFFPAYSQYVEGPVRFTKFGLSVSWRVFL